MQPSTGGHQVRQYNVPAVEKAIAILDALAEAGRSLSTTEIHSLLDLPKATTFMILNVLERHDVVKKDRDGRYVIGLKLYQWGTSYIAEMDIAKTAHPYLVELSRQTGLTSHLGTLQEHSMMFVDKVEPESFIRFSTFPGMRQDIHVSSLGKAIAAHLPDEEQHGITENGSLAAYTPHSLTDSDSLKREFERIRLNGYAIEDEEGELGVRCVGAPVFGRDGQVVAAVSVTGVVSQIDRARFGTLGSQVRGIADMISSQLGFIQPAEGPTPCGESRPARSGDGEGHVDARVSATRAPAAGD
jgi:DNA-binding IclR family transcriptional regulator